MYLVDTSVLVEAKNRYYGFDIAPEFWAWLDLDYEQSVACSMDAVRSELLQVAADHLAGSVPRAGMASTIVRWM